MNSQTNSKMAFQIWLNLMFASILQIFLPTYSMTSTDASRLHQTDQPLNGPSEVQQCSAEKYGIEVPFPYSFNPKGKVISDLFHK